MSLSGARCAAFFARLYWGGFATSSAANAVHSQNCLYISSTLVFFAKASHGPKSPRLSNANLASLKSVERLSLSVDCCVETIVCPKKQCGTANAPPRLFSHTHASFATQTPLA